MNAIEVKNLNRRLGDFFELTDIDLTLPKGFIMGLIGRNGAGKSSLIKAILNVMDFKGQINILEKDVELVDKNKIGFYSSEFTFPEYLSVNKIENLMKNIYSYWDSEKFDAYMKQFDIEKKQRYGSLSKGMKTKLALAIALSHNAELLILDEPAEGLDPVARDELNEIIFDFTRSEDHTVLISSHIVSDLEKICDYIAVMRDGKIVMCDEKDAICEKYVIAQASVEDFNAVPYEHIIGKKESPYGIKGIVVREYAPANAVIKEVTLEDMFVYMEKEAQSEDESYAD